MPSSRTYDEGTTNSASKRATNVYDSQQPSTSSPPRSNRSSGTSTVERASRSTNATVPTTQYANNRIECDHGRLKALLRPMRGLRTDRTASTVIRGHAFVQNLRRGHYELGVEARHERLRVAAAFDELAASI
jgi:transposase-like protein